MMTLSKALAAGQAKDYFQAEYTNVQESYYSEGETVKGRWFGKQAEAWNLQGDVDQEHFDRPRSHAAHARQSLNDFFVAQLPNFPQARNDTLNSLSGDILDRCDFRA